MVLSLDIPETDRWKHLPVELELHASCLAGSQLLLATRSSQNKSHVLLKETWQLRNGAWGCLDGALFQ